MLSSDINGFVTKNIYRTCTYISILDEVTLKCLQCYKMPNTDAISWRWCQYAHENMLVVFVDCCH